MSDTKHAVVIGAGLGGLSTAALLAKRGLRVTVIEKNDRPGGRAMMLEKDGYRFDMGPSWYMMPEIFDQFFARFGAKTSDFYELIRLSPSYKVFWDKHDPITIGTDPAETHRLFEQIEPGAGREFDRFLEDARRKYAVGVGKFVYRDFQSLRDILHWDLLKALPGLNLYESLERFLKRRFSDERLRQLLSFHTVFLGGSPRNVPAMYAMMAHADFNLGIWYPKGGMIQVVDALYALGQQQGVEYRLNAPVDEILTQHGRAVGVRIGSEQVGADFVISNADYAHTELSLLSDADRSYGASYWRKRTMAPGTFLIYLGLDRQFPELTHHSFYFQPDWNRHFDQVFRNPAWPDRPCYYINAPTRTDDTLAPAGHDALMVLVPVAAGLESDTAFKNQYAEAIIEHIRQTTGADLAPHIRTIETAAPADFASLYNAYAGSAFGVAHTLFQTAMFRPGRRSRKVSNLFYVGQYTHPGIGVPVAPITAELTVQKIIQAGEI